MRPPVSIRIFIRSEKSDAAYTGQSGVKDKNLLHSPAGGAFGMVRSHGHKGHQGWDIYAPVNTPVVAIADGVIADVRYGHGYGRNVILKFKHLRYPGGLYAVYAHLSQASVSRDQSVREGETLGYSGTDGNAHGSPPHLHFEIRTMLNPPPGDPKNPKSVLNHRISPGEILGGHYNL